MGIYSVGVVDYSIAATIGVVAIACLAMLGRRLNLRLDLAIAITCACLTLAYAKFLQTMWDGSDSLFYYSASLEPDDFNLGTKAVVHLTSFFSETLGLGFLPVNAVFGVVGAVACLILYSAYLKSSVFLPSAIEIAVFFLLLVVAIGFWGGGISKDSIALLGSSLFCLGLVNSRPRLFMIAAGVAAMLLVRPHIAAAMLAGLALAVPLARNLPLSRRGPLLALSGLALLILVPFVLWYAGLEGVTDLTDLQDNIEDRTTNYAGSTGFVDLSALPWPLRMVSYLFRPLPYEARSITQFLASGQNMLFLLVVVMLLWQVRHARAHWRDFGVLALLLFALAAWVPLGVGTSNLGISVRQKWMFVPALLLALVQLRSHVQARQIIGRSGYDFQSTAS